VDGPVRRATQNRGPFHVRTSLTEAAMFWKFGAEGDLIRVVSFFVQVLVADISEKLDTEKMRGGQFSKRIRGPRKGLIPSVVCEVVVGDVREGRKRSTVGVLRGANVRSHRARFKHARVAR